MTKRLGELINNIIRKNEFDKPLNTITEYVNGLIRTNEKLRLRLKNYDAKSGIAALEEEMRKLRNQSLYIMNEKEEQAAKEFREKHYKTCKGSIEYVLTPTGIGTAISIVCSECHERENITDYSTF